MAEENKYRIGNILSLIILCTLFTGALIRLYPFQPGLTEYLTGVDDWNRYVRLGLDIKENGLSIPSVTGVYEGPGGFLYNYFLAVCFTLFGEHAFPVFLIQSLLLGLSIRLVYLTFRDKLNKITGILLMLSLFFFAWVDVYRIYTFKFLSENAAIFTASCFVYYVKMIFEHRKFYHEIMAILSLTATVLLRPNFIICAAIYIPFIFIYSYRLRILNPLKTSLLITLLPLGISTIAFRNHLACNQWTYLPVEGTDYAYTHHQPGYYWKKFLFSIGYLSILEPEYRIRPQWIVLWLLFLISLIYKFIKRKLLLFDGFVLLLIVTYYGAALLFTQVGSYGYRIFLPAILTTLIFPIEFIQSILVKKT